MLTAEANRIMGINVINVIMRQKSKQLKNIHHLCKGQDIKLKQQNLKENRDKRRNYEVSQENSGRGYYI